MVVFFQELEECRVIEGVGFITVSHVDQVIPGMRTGKIYRLAGGVGEIPWIYRTYNKGIVLLIAG
jgi:hypothetical protein